MIHKKEHRLILIIVLHWSLFLRCGFAAKTNWEFNPSGEFKPIIGYQALRHQNVFSRSAYYFSENRFRLSATAAKSFFRIEFANELNFIVQEPNNSIVPLPNYNPEPFWRTDSKISNDWRHVLTHRIDRANLQFNLDPVEIQLGKQVIPIGVGNIFNTISQVPRYPFMYLDPEFEKTEDAAAVIYKGKWVVEARFLPKTRSQGDHNYHSRIKMNTFGFDSAVTLGRSDNKYFTAIESVGNFGEGVLKTELGGYFYPSGNSVQAMLGYDRVLTSKFSTQTEVFYNGFGETHSNQVTAFPHRATPYRAKWYLGSLLTYEIEARLKANLLSIVNLNDPSGLFHFYFIYSCFENFDFILGQYLNIKSHAKSEFGGVLPLPGLPQYQVGLPDITYLLMRISF